MKNFDKVEAYFNNELSDSEKNDFLREVDTNAELKAEYNFQNEVVNGIKNARKAELKAMLNNVPVTSIGTSTSGLYKLLAGGVATLMVGTASWYYFNASPTSEVVTQNNVVEVVPETKGEENTVSIEEKVVVDEFTEFTKEGSNSTTTEATNNLPIVNTPNLPNSEDTFENKTLPEENLDIPDNISNADINLSTKVDVEIKLKKKYSFHYQYSKGKLVLYGNFEEGLFEILELNKESNVEVYLYYKANYYFIKDTSKSIQPLKSVNDKSLKIKLDRLR
jgi:hypothetical protein